MNTDIWIVLIEDRHADVEAMPFSSEKRAVEAAREQVLKNARHPDDIDWDVPMTTAARADGWVFLAEYGTETESERVRVVRRALDAR